MANPENISIEVVYPLPHEQLLMALKVPEGSCIRDGILASGILDRYPELNIDTLETGIFGKLAKLDQPLRERDRIEVYRPLIADPKAVRKQRAAQGKAMKKGGGDAESEGEA